MTKVIDLEATVFTLVQQYPELKEILLNLGFSEIVNPIMFNTMGKIMTLKKGSKVKKIPLDQIIKTLEEKGFEVIHQPKFSSETKDTKVSREREALLKSYVQRLTQGEDMEAVRQDFKAHFKDVSAVEIARAEQALLQEGVKLKDVQKLCDVHSALFHGTTTRERRKETTAGFDQEIANKTEACIQEKGHPLHILSLENRAIEEKVTHIQTILNQGTEISTLDKQLRELQEITRHYKKKQETIYPLLKVNYDYPGPSEVMWGVEDEIKTSLSHVLSHLDEKHRKALQLTLDRIHEMIYKEENILFPICVANFKEEEWLAMAKDFPTYGPCLMAEMPRWDRVKVEEDKLDLNDQEIQISGGHMSLAQLKAMLNTLPMEITLVDEKDINVYFNEGEKLFTRPQMALGRPVYSCHPMRVEPMVRLLIHDFKMGKRNSMHILSEKQGQDVLVNYYALRNKKGDYLGTLEAVQVVTGLKKAILKGKKGPIDL